jgi:hypothetical protein
MTSTDDRVTRDDVLRWLDANYQFCEELADAIHRDYVHIHPMQYSSADTYCAIVNWVASILERMDASSGPDNA